MIWKYRIDVSFYFSANLTWIITCHAVPRMQFRPGDSFGLKVNIKVIFSNLVIVWQTLWPSVCSLHHVDDPWAWHQFNGPLAYFFLHLWGGQYKQYRQDQLLLKDNQNNITWQHTWNGRLHYCYLWTIHIEDQQVSEIAHLVHDNTHLYNSLINE